MRRCEAPAYGREHFAQTFSRQAVPLVLSVTSLSVFSSRESKHFDARMRSRFVIRHCYGFVPRMSDDGPGASSFRTFVNAASSSHFFISLKLKVPPLSVLTSICTENISEGSGLVRPSFTSHSATAIVRPDFRARKVSLSNRRSRCSPSLCRIWTKRREIVATAKVCL